MIKAMGTTGGRPMLIIGLSGENMTRLMADEPIMFRADEIGGPELTVVVVGGRTEDNILADLRAHFPIGEFRDQRGDQR